MIYYVGSIECRGDYLEHHGIKGQKWGIRRTPEELGHETNLKIKSKANNGKIVTLGQRPSSKFTNFVAKFLPSVRENIKRDKQFNISVDGKKIGDAEIFNEGDGKLNVVWVGVDETERGKGYATATMNGIINYAKKQRYKKVTLEVPGISPDANHIYTKLGFKPIEQVSNKYDVWGGLTSMELDL